MKINIFNYTANNNENILLKSSDSTVLVFYWISEEITRLILSYRLENEQRTNTFIKNDEMKNWTKSKRKRNWFAFSNAFFDWILLKILIFFLLVEAKHYENDINIAWCGDNNSQTQCINWKNKKNKSLHFFSVGLLYFMLIHFGVLFSHRNQKSSES